MAADTGVTTYPADDDLNLPSDKTISPKSAGDGHYTFVQWLQRVTGFVRAIYADYVVGHKPNPNAHHNRQHSVASAPDHLFDADVNFGAHNVSASNAPTSGNHLTNKTYVDNQITGARDPKDSVRVATAAALPAYTRALSVLTANANGALPNIDGVALAVGDRLLVKDGASASDNGLYTVTSLGSGGTPWVLTRAADMDLSTETTNGAFTWAVEGTVNGKLGWLLTTPDPIVLNVTGLTWTQIAGLTDVVAGAGLTKTGNQLDAVANADGSITVNADDIQVTPGKFSQALTPTAVKTANYAAAAGDFVPVDTTAGAVTITLPTAPADKTRIAVKLVVLGGSNAVTISAGGSDVFNKAGGSTSLTLSLVNQALNLQYKASSSIWYVVADDLPLGDLDSRFVPVTLFDANTVLTADTDDTPHAVTMGASTILARLAAGNIKAATPAELKALLAIAEGDVTGLTADLAALVPKSLFDANTILAATTDDTPAALTVGPSTLVGRKASGGIVAATPAEARVILGAERAILREAAMRPAAAVAETFPRDRSIANQGPLATGRLSLFGVYLVAGEVVTNIVFWSGTTAYTPGTHQWFALYSYLTSTTFSKLGVTADDGATAWAANSKKSLAMASPYTVPTSGWYYFGICVVGGTVPSLFGIGAGQANLSSENPPISIACDSGLTDPASAPNTATSVGGSGSWAYAYAT